MSRLFYDRVKETTTTTGTGDITLAGAVNQFVSFSSRYAVGDLFRYAIVGQTGTEWEGGEGTLLTTTTFRRLRIFVSSNADAAVNFSAGTKDVFVTIPADYMNKIYTQGQILASLTGNAMP